MKLTGEVKGVDPRGVPSGGAQRSKLRGENRVLVVQGLEPARAQDRLAHPLQPEHQEQPADDEPEDVDRQRRQRRAQRANNRGQREQRCANPNPSGAPATGDSGGKDDRDRLNPLDRARDEHADEQQNLAGHQRLPA